METMHSRKPPVVVLILAVLMLSLPLFSQQAVVELGLAGDYVILAESGITTTGVTHITGDIAVSPIDLAAITGFGETMHSSGTYATSDLVTGKIYASDMTEPTPTNLTTAVTNMGTAYTDATGRTEPVYTGVSDALNATILDFGPGLYKWSGNVSIPNDITIRGNANDVWIFEIAGTFNISADVTVFLSSGAQAKNIFWAVAQTVDIFARAQLPGTILSRETIAFRDGALLYGKALSHTNVTLIGNTLIDDTEPIPATLPVTLSSFTAEVTTTGMVTLQWTAETETNMLGYNVYRNTANVLAEAAAINSGIIPAKNSSVAAYYNFTDESVIPGSTYYYWLQSMDLDLSNTFHGPISVQVAEDGEEGSVKPPELTTKLLGAYPNPFNPTTTIKYSIKEETGVSLGIYNLQGQIVRILVDGVQRSGEHSIAWDGTDYTRKAVGSGVYFYRLTTDHYDSVNKMILLK